MAVHPHELAILEEHRRVRYLKIIALFKIFKGLLLFLLGFSLLFLNYRPGWLDQISDWADDQLLLAHSKYVIFLLNKLQAALSGGALRATGTLALFYCGVLLTEGIGVYLQKRWAELLMIFATSALIPFEIHHLFIKRSIGAVVILAVNCFIVWFLYRVLRRERPHTKPAVAREVAKIS